MMAFGNQPLDASRVPLSSGYVPNDTFRGIQGSLLKYTDGSTNISTAAVTSDVVREMVINGQSYSALYSQTIGSSAQGNYLLSLFNPSGSAKNVLVTSIKTMVNYSAAITWVFLNTVDPTYNTAITALNMKGGGAASALAGHITANSAAGSFPSNNIDQALGPELITNNMAYYLPAVNGISVLLYVNNSQQYAIAVKWIEF